MNATEKQFISPNMRRMALLTAVRKVKAELAGIDKDVEAQKFIAKFGENLYYLTHPTK